MHIDHADVQRRLERRTGRRNGIVLVHLDAVIDSRPRNLAIYRAAVGEFPELVTVIDRITRGEIEPGIGTLQQETTLDPAGRAALYAFWHSRYHEESWLHHDVPFPGASEFLRQLHESGSTIIYLSGRYEPVLGYGTREWMRQHRLPLEPSASFLFRSGMEMPELEFVERALHPFRSRGIDLVVESRADRANLIHEIVPHALIYLVSAGGTRRATKLYPSIMTEERYAAVTA